MENLHYQKAFSLLMRHEGGYAFDPDDPGGETYKGISRKYHPDWLGWKLVDEHKDSRLFPEILEIDKDLNSDIQEFYFEKYWKKSRAIDVANYVPDIALQLFDFAVNSDMKLAQLRFQEICNLLNNGFSDPIKVDGAIGSNTLRLFKIVTEKRDWKIFLYYYQGKRLEHYSRIIDSNQSQSKFAAGWAYRVFSE